MHTYMYTYIYTLGRLLGAPWLVARGRALRGPWPSPSSQQDSVAILPSFVGWAGPLAALPSSRQKEGPRGTWLTCVRRPPPQQTPNKTSPPRRRETGLLAQKSCFFLRGAAARSRSLFGSRMGPVRELHTQPAHVPHALRVRYMYNRDSNP